MSEAVADVAEVKRDTLWVTDAEIIRRLGAPRDTAREALRMLDSKPSGFPKKQKLWGNRRYWPAVEAYFDKLYGGTLVAPQRRERQ